jgi:prepilin-type N-terminal cleavage/methylation domain-containing protein
MRTKKGFTLVELLVVIAIIALLLSILMPSLKKVRDLAKRTVCGNNVKQVGIGVAAYVADNDDSLPFYGGYDPSFSGYFYKSTASDELHPYAAYRGDKSPWMGPPLVPMKLACLFANNYITDAKLFYCPANRDLNYMYKSYINGIAPNTGNKWGTLPQAYNSNKGQNQWVRVGYAYYPIDEILIKAPTGMSPVGGVVVPKYTARKFGRLSRSAPYLSDMLWSREDVSHRGSYNKANNKVADAGMNVLFKDGHVYYAKDQKLTFWFGVNTNKQQMLFDNDFWTNWDPVRGAEKPDDLDARYLFYNIYSAIKP